MGGNKGEELEAKPSVVGLHYRVGRKIGEGSFGAIYEGIHMIDNRPIAIKFEPKSSDAPQLRDEFKSYKLLSGCFGIPSVFYYGQEGSYNCLVMDLLGHSLEDMFDLCGRKFSVKTVALLAKQMITRVQTIHEKNLIYRDIKPDNFLMGRKDKSHIVFMVDFGMAKHYRDPKTKQHIPYKERKSLSGTARYMSINTHLGREQSRRDDLEALGNVFMYFLRGSLPWQGLKAATNKQKYEKIRDKKQEISVKELTEGFPEEFSTYLSYIRKLSFEETPDYDYLRSLFHHVLLRLNEAEDNVYDWMILVRREHAERSSICSVSQLFHNQPEEQKRVQPAQDYLNQRRGSAMNASTRPMYGANESEMHSNIRYPNLTVSELKPSGIVSSAKQGGGPPISGAGQPLGGGGIPDSPSQFRNPKNRMEHQMKPLRNSPPSQLNLAARIKQKCKKFFKYLFGSHRSENSR